MQGIKQQVAYNYEITMTDMIYNYEGFVPGS